MQKVMNQHQNNQFAQDVPFMGGDEKSEDAKSDGTGIFDPGNVHSQVSFICLPCSDIRTCGTLRNNFTQKLQSDVRKALLFRPIYLDPKA